MAGSQHIVDHLNCAKTLALNNNDVFLAYLISIAVEEVRVSRKTRSVAAQTTDHSAIRLARQTSEIPVVAYDI